MKRLLSTLIMLALCFLVIISNVDALRVSPATKELDYNTKNETYALKVTNDESRTLNVQITPTGPLSPLIDIGADITLAPGETKELPITVTVPRNTQPGTLESGVLIEAKPLSGSTVSASSAVFHIIRVHTPKEGSFLSGELLSSSGILGDPVLVTVALTNTGTESAEASTTVILNGPDTFTLPAPTIRLEQGETKNVVVSWVPKAVGEYEAQAKIHYADKEETLVSRIVVGNFSIRLLEVIFGSFSLGEPFKVDVMVVNDWGETLPVTVTVDLHQMDALTAQGESTVYRSSPLVNTTIPVYLEPKGIQAQEGTLTVTLHYPGRDVSTDYPVVIGVDSIDFRNPFVGSLVSLIVTVILVVVLLYLIYLWWRKRKRAQKKQQESSTVAEVAYDD